MDARLSEEQAFFDAVEYDEGPIANSTVERYLRCAHPFLAVERPYWLLGDVRGKRVLEIGSGDGCHSILLAMRGAEVVGVDISPRAVEVARRRAEYHQVAHRTTFAVIPAEEFSQRLAQTFDIICGFSILHHLIPVLDSTMAGLCRIAHEGTRFLFVEPVAFSRTLRRLRLMLPVSACGTPGERPLEAEELAILRRHLPNLSMHRYDLFSRLWTRCSPGRYEDFSPLRRGIYHTIARVDNLILRCPGLDRLAGSAILYAPGRAARPAAGNLESAAPLPH